MVNVKFSFVVFFRHTTMLTNIRVSMSSFPFLFIPVWSIVINSWKNLGLAKAWAGTIFTTRFNNFRFFADKRFSANFTDTFIGIIRRMINAFPPFLFAFYRAKNLISIFYLRHIFNFLFSTITANIFFLRMLTLKGVFSPIQSPASNRTKHSRTSFGMIWLKHFSTFCTRFFTMLHTAFKRAKIETIFINSSGCLKRFIAVITDTMKTCTLISRAFVTPFRPINYLDSAVKTMIIKSSVIVAFHLSQVYNNVGIYARGLNKLFINMSPLAHKGEI